jgi:hypothetical protein
VTFELLKRFFTRRDAPGRRDFLRTLAIGAAGHRFILNALAAPDYRLVTRAFDIAGCSLTRVSIHPLSPAELEFMAFHEAIRADVFRTMNIAPEVLFPRGLSGPIFPSHIAPLPVPIPPDFFVGPNL